ncbi:MAG: outer membrane protein assembly factor BamE [Thermodesulfobacteriota bacterium]|jgi:outer membrane protein assembly factor BamE (lipoprotein component of BamABCDE complex)
MRVRWIFFVASFLLICSCASIGDKRIAKEEILTQIKVGQSTKSDCRALLGEPTNISFSDDGEETWMYMYTRATTRPTTFIPVVGIFAGGTNMQMHNFTVRFNKDGIVKQMGKGSSKGGAGSVFD